MTVLLLAHAGATLAMAGLIWFVQLVHYPLFDRAERDRFTEFESEHQRRTTVVVMPLMVTELVTAAWLLVEGWRGPQQFLLLIGAVLLAVIWLSTALLQVPLHGRLSGGFDAVTHRRLVATNWIRTLAWSARGVLSLALLAGR